MPLTPHQAIIALLAAQEVEPAFPAEVMAEVEALLAAPAIDDPSLDDLTSLPFVTIDYEQSKDLDQALLIERTGAGGGYLVRYALADAAHYVRPNTALFMEALARGVSHYLPGLTVPMLPPELSEGIISLNQGVDRRALVFEIRLDGAAMVQETRVIRARIHSQAKLSYDGVQEEMDSGWSGPLGNAAFTDSLKLLREVGERLMAAAEERDVIRFNREDVEVQVVAEELIITSQPRNMVSRYNEQLSLLCNTEGGRLLLGDGEPVAHVQPVYRVHQPPDPEALNHLEQRLLALAPAHGVDVGHLAWRRSSAQGPRENLGAYLERLQREELPPGLVKAVERQALIANSPSRFSSSPGPHYALGVRPYSRFSAPMREIVGIFTHKEALEKLGLDPVGITPEEDEQVRELVIQAGNRGKEKQRALDRAVKQLAIHQLLSRDLELPMDQRPARTGTVLGLRPSRIYLRLDDPPVELKVYREDLERWAKGPLKLSEDEVMLASSGGEGPRLVMGDVITVRLEGRDKKRNRWRLAPV